MITEAFIKLNLSEGLTVAEAQQLMEMARKRETTVERILFEAAQGLVVTKLEQPSTGHVVTVTP